VVWSGMNLVGHIRKYGNSEEMGFIRSLIQWLLPESKSDHVDRLEVQRDNPDRITLRIPGPIDKGTFLLWREAHAPGWHASVKVNGVDENVKIYRAGPGMMLMNLPFSQDDEVVVTMEYSLDLVRGVGQAVTVLTGILLLGLVAGKFGAPRSDTGHISGTLKRDPHHRLGASDRDIGIHTRRSSMWKRLFGWLPKPFLDEKIHHEETNQKSGEYSESGSTDEGTDSEMIQEIRNESIFEVEFSDDEEILLKAWLDHTNPTDDSWIRKTLGKEHQGNKQ
ncbi:MAG: hypothetical protein KAV87_64275, partial [Desulfobacteraceae bacterium]|nr:hypothetical protein [Desulfobacteraceae bacterium]